MTTPQKFSVLVLVSALISCKSTGQLSNLWNELPKETEVAGSITPSEFLVYELDHEAFKKILSSLVSDTSKVRVSFPNPLGKMQEYTVTRSGVVAEELVEKFPNLATYKGVSDLNPSSKIRFEMPRESLQLMGIEASGTWFISPLESKENQRYIIYFKDKLQRANDFWEGKIK